MLTDKEQKATSPVDSVKTIEKSIEAASPLEESSVEVKKSASNSKEKKSLTKNLSLRDRDRDCVKYVNEKSSMNVRIIYILCMLAFFWGQCNFSLIFLHLFLG